MNNEIERLMYAEERRHVAEIKSIVQRWPEYRLHLAYALLGGAVAVVDTFGGDVEGWLKKLRETEPRPDVIEPPSGVQS
jgi:hypothetical protein